VICGLLVSRRMVFVHAGWVLVVLLVMAIAEARGWLPHCPPLEAEVTRPIESARYLISIGVVTIVTFVTISIVVGGIAGRLRRRELELDEVRQELERHARQVEAAHAKLKKLDRDRISFFRLVSHQLRSPLSSIQTVLKLVTSGYAEQPEKAAELVARAELQSQHMLAMLNDMLSLTRVREAAQVEAPEMVALGPMVADVVEASQNAALAKKITLTADIASELPSISAIRNHAKQLFAILVENAVKYTPEGGTVEVTAEYDKGEVRVAVTDTGIGVPPDEMGEIFGEFFRASNARKHEHVGTGLGLSIGKKVADDLGGRIEVTSSVGRGSTFTVVLPVSPSGNPG